MRKKCEKLQWDSKDIRGLNVQGYKGYCFRKPLGDLEVVLKDAKERGR